VDGLNRRVSQADVVKTYQPARDAYRAASAADGIVIVEGEDKPAVAAKWLLASLRGK
jgi:hypothetical protein